MSEWTAIGALALQFGATECCARDPHRATEWVAERQHLLAPAELRTLDEARADMNEDLAAAPIDPGVCEMIEKLLRYAYRSGYAQGSHDVLENNVIDCDFNWEKDKVLMRNALSRLNSYDLLAAVFMHTRAELPAMSLDEWQVVHMENLSFEEQRTAHAIMRLHEAKVGS